MNQAVSDAGWGQDRGAVVKQQSTLHAVLFTLLLVFYAFLVFHNLGSVTLWNDEGLSYYAAADGFAQTYRNIARDTHPPLYYLALSLWMNFGQDTFALRSLSAIAAIVSLPFVYMTARMLIGRNWGLVATLLYCVSPATVMWAQKARPYSLQTMFIAIALFGFVRILLSVRSATAANGASPPDSAADGAFGSVTAGWLAYVLGGGLAMLTQHPAGFFVFACNVVMAVVILPELGRHRRLLYQWIVAQVLIAAIWLTWLPQFISQVHEHLLPERIAIKQPQYIITNVWPGFVEFLGTAHLWRLQPAPLIISLAVVSLAVFGAIRKRNANVLHIFLLCVTPVVLGVLGFYLVHPVFGYVIFVLHWFVIPYSVLLAYGVASTGNRVIGLILLLGLLLLNARGLMNYYDETTDRLDNIAEFIAQNARQGDGIVFSHSDAGRFGVAYYLPPQWKTMPGLDTSIPGDDIIHSVDEAKKYQRLWVVVPKKDVPAVTLAQLAEIGHLAVDQQYRDFIVRRYDRAS